LTLVFAGGIFQGILNSPQGDPMTELLKKAFDAVSKLSPKTQDAIAARLLVELEDEDRWDEAFAKSQDKLARMADEAIREYKDGKTVPLEDIL
jgi:hypothetical protein